jgi:O-antigen ligase
VTWRAALNNLPALMNREVLERWCERGILALILGVLVFGPLAMGAVDRWAFLVIQGLTLGVLLLWGLRLWFSLRPQLLWPPICWVVVAFAGYAIVRYLTADIEYVARQELIRILVYAVLFFAILNNLHRQEATQAISFTLIFLAMAISFYAIYQFLAASHWVWRFPALYPGRGSGTYMSPNHLAGFLEMVLPLALACTLVGRSKPVTKVFLGYAALAIVAGIGATVSRGGWVSSGLALVAFFGILAFHRSYRLPALVLMLVLIGGGVFFVSKTEYFKDRFRKAFESGRVELDVRRDLWDATARMWRDHVWWGVGPGHFDYRFRAYRPVLVQKRPDRAHNEYLNTLVDWGVAGVAIVAAAWAALFWGVVKTWKHVRRSENALGARSLSNKFALVLGATTGLVALLAHSAVDFNMHIPANAILAVSLMALLSGCLRFATERYWLAARLGVKLLTTLALAACFGYLGWQGWRQAGECVLLERAARLQKFSPAQAVALEKAFAAEPKNFETAWAIGEAYRMQFWPGVENDAELADKAMKWFERGIRLNRFDGYNYLYCGMCLDKMDRHDEAGTCFNRADELDPTGYFTAAWIGWHYVQIEDYAAAKPWFERSLRLQWKDNPIAASYLEIVNRKLLEGAAGGLALPGGLQSR